MCVSIKIKANVIKTNADVRVWYTENGYICAAPLIAENVQINIKYPEKKSLR